LETIIASITGALMPPMDLKGKGDQIREEVAEIQVTTTIIPNLNLELPT
jgi:hypothetical protein